MLYSSLFFREKKNFIPIHCKLYTINFFTHVVHWSQINKKFTHEPCESEMHVFFFQIWFWVLSAKKALLLSISFCPTKKKTMVDILVDLHLFVSSAILSMCVCVFFFIFHSQLFTGFFPHTKKTDSIGQSLVISFVGDWTQLLQAFHT